MDPAEMKHAQTLEVENALLEIKRAWNEGRQIVPLLGSGISIDAGFPLGKHLVDHMIAVSTWLRHQGWADPRGYLQKYGWPSRHGAASEWLLVNERWDKANRPVIDAAGLAKKFDEEKQQLYRKCIADEIRRHAPMAASKVDAVMGDGGGGPSGYTDYRSLLNFLTNRDAGLIDAYFDHFVRDRPPAATHQFLAFIVQLLDTRLILTTNFDTMIETALRAEGLRPTVYEVTREGAVPSAVLVRKQRLAVVKLHGGAYSLRTGFDLDDPLPVATLAEVRNYLAPQVAGQKSPLLLVLGYSGSDRRVMDIVADHLEQRSSGTDLQVLWLQWDGIAPQLLENAARRFGKENPPADPAVHLSVGDERRPDRNPVGVCRYREGRLFLQELFQCLARQHAVSQTHYEVLTHIPRSPQPAAALGKEVYRLSRNVEVSALTASARNDRNRKNENFIVFWAKTAGCGTSDMLAREVDELGATHQVIWIDASEIRSRASLFVLIEEAFRRQDRALCPVTRPLMIEDVDYLARETQGFKDPNEKEPEFAAQWIKHAMRRGRYVLAIDSLGEFAAGHPAMPGPTDTQAPEQVLRVIEFLNLLCEQQDQYGESKILVAATPNPVLAIDKECAIAGWLVLAPGECKRKLDSLRKKSTNVAHPHDAGPAQRAVREIRELCKSADERDRGVVVLLVLASFCRRPRSRTALRVLLFRLYFLWKNERYFKDECFHECFEAFRLVVEKQPGAEIQQVHLACDVLLGHAEGKRIEDRERVYTLLLRQEGGFYWMHHSVRDGIFRHVARDATDRAGESHPETEAKREPGLTLNKEEISKIFDLIANFAHDDLFERSQDSTAFVEYMHYRTASILHATTNQSSNGVPEATDRLRWLVGTLEQEREKMLARGRLTAVLNHIRTILRMLDTSDPDMPHGLSFQDRVDCLYRVVRSYADMLIACGHPVYALRYRIWQAMLAVGQRMRDPSITSPNLAELARTAKNTLESGFDKWMLAAEASAGDSSARELAETKLHRICQSRIDLAVALSHSLLLNKVEPADGTDEREQRFDLASKLFEAKYIEKLGHVTNADGVTELLSRSKVRRLEHKLREFGDSRFWATSTVEPGDIKGFRKECNDALVEIRGGPSRSRRRRHKAYLLLCRARYSAQVKRHFDSARVYFRRAQSAISRRSGASERTALAMTLLFEAEARLMEEHDVRLRALKDEQDRIDSETLGIEYLERMAEDSKCAEPIREHVKRAREQLERERQQRNDRETNRIIHPDVEHKSARLWQEAEVLLHQAESALSAGRVESRWRVFLYLLQAELFLRRFEHSGREDQFVQRRLLRDAMNAFIAGRINVGQTTDFRLVLERLLTRIKKYLETPSVYAVDLATVPERVWSLFFDAKLPDDAQRHGGATTSGASGAPNKPPYEPSQKVSPESEATTLPGRNDGNETKSNEGRAPRESRRTADEGASNS